MTRGNQQGRFWLAHQDLATHLIEKCLESCSRNIINFCLSFEGQGIYLLTVTNYFPNSNSIRMQDLPENYFDEWRFLGKY